MQETLTQETSQADTEALEKIMSNTEYAVEGCHYEIAREERHKELLNFIRYQFLPDEPISRSIAHIMPWTEEIEYIWMSVIGQNMSLVLVSDNTDEIVAIRVTRISKRVEDFDWNKLQSEGLKKVIGLVHALQIQCNIYEHYNVEEAIEFVSLGVHRDYRKKGIGLKIMRAAIALIKNMELNGVIVKGEGSSNYSQRIYEKVGFDTHAEVFYDDHKEDGEVVFKNMGEHKSTIQYAMFVC